MADIWAEDRVYQVIITVKSDKLHKVIIKLAALKMRQAGYNAPPKPNTYIINNFPNGGE
jgi:hypothetical protein